MSETRDTTLEHLHPVFRQKVTDLLAKLESKELPFRLFEGFRTPQRQRYLYAQGRTRPGDIVTYARAWHSNHQYGVAADFVLFENGKWSWDDGGKKEQWWKELHSLGRGLGLTPLSFETPHLEMVDLDLDDLMSGRYPAGGDREWAENLAAAIYSWTGSPEAPPVPQIISDRPPLKETPITPGELGETPLPGSQSWHSYFDGQEWRYDERGVYLRDYADGDEPIRTRGEPITCREIMKRCGEEILAASKKYQIPMALIIMTIATETGIYRKYGFTGPYTFRWEPHVEVTDVSPHLWGDYSAGPMQTLATTAREVIQRHHLSYDAFKVAPVYERRPEPPEVHPLYDYATNIDIGGAEIKYRWDRTGNDQILVAAAFNAGGLYESDKNAWRLRSTGDHLDRAARWYGDACAVIKEMAG